MDSPTSDALPTPRRRLRRVLLVLVLAVVVIAGLIIGFLPAIISSRLPGWISSSVETSLGANAELDASVLSWGGEQSLEGLRLKERRSDGTSRTVLSVRRAVIKNSLLDLLGGGSAPLTIEIEEPVIEVHRDASGSLNWARLLGVEGLGDDPRSDASKSDDSGSKEGPISRDRRPALAENSAGPADPVSWNIERELIVKVRNGRIRYRDDVLSTKSDLESCTVDLKVGKETVTAELSARVVQPGAADTTAGELPWSGVRWSGVVTGLKESFHPDELSVKVEGVISAVDLRPYRAVLEELAGVEVPAEPVDGRFTVEARDGKLFSEIDLDAGFVSLFRSQLPECLELGENTHASFTELVLDDSLEGGRGSAVLTGSLRYQGYRVSRIAANFEINEQRLVFSDVDADLNGGRLIAPRLELDMTGEKPGYKLELGIEDVEANYDMSPLLAYVVPFLSLEGRQSALSGKITASLKLEGRGFEVADLDTLEGGGQFRLRDGQFQGSRFLREVARLVGTDVDRVAFSELGSDFSFSAGAIASDNVFLIETSNKLRHLGLKGTTTVRGELDFGVDLAALEKTVGDRRIRDVLRGVSAVLGGDGVPIRLGGTLKAPRLTWGASPKQKRGKGVGGLLDKIFGQ